ncbi:putative carboxysome-like ethanolaminosome structural protein, ethanolamine utilization protein [Ruminococcaceae bacterium BL-6]|nr:putative carboxysome-like ethanolaminosome structural protein, ethanolamine utilization protein [Ruminococcaceae bacterium BL-6]
MIVCRITGTVVCTQKAEGLVGLKMQIVQPLNLLTMKEDGTPFVAVDAVGAGDGEIVLVVSGSSARQTALTGNRPVDATVTAIVDTIDANHKTVFDRDAGRRPV